MTKKKNQTESELSYAQNANNKTIQVQNYNQVLKQDEYVCL